jgi:truncated hemoglobin YjbI
MKEQALPPNSDPKMYHLSASMVTSNQREFRKNYLKELLDQQEKTNRTFSKSVSHLTHTFSANKIEQQSYYHRMLHKLSDQAAISENLEMSVAQSKKTNKELLQRLEIIDNKLEEQRKSLDEEMILSQAAIDQLTVHDDYIRKVHQKMESYEELYLDLQKKMKAQELFYMQIDEKLQIQEIFHKTVLERLDKQDVAAEKISGQLDSLRNVLVEKLETAIESIEFKYKQAMQYIVSFFGIKERIIQRPTALKENNQKEKMEIKQE